MPLLWPFGGRKRTSTTSTTTTSVTAAAALTAGTGAGARAGAGDMTAVAVAVAVDPLSVSDSATAAATAVPAQATNHGGRSSSPHRLGNNNNSQGDRRGSVQTDLTALPALPELEASPHLRPISANNKAVHPYHLDRPSSSSARRQPRDSTRNITAASASTPAADVASSASRKSTTSRRPSTKRSKDQVLREEGIRQMSAPMYIPKRPAGSANDLLRRDSKKARKTLTKRSDTSRTSNVSLPMADSFRSSMSALAEQRAWEVGTVSFLSPRPTVRLSGQALHAPPSAAGKRRYNMDKLPELAHSFSKKDRKKVADLADDLDSTELRVLMERDQRRRERKANEQHERLDRKLRKRAEKQLLEDERQAQEACGRAAPPPPPTAIHPAFRDHHDEADFVAPVALKKDAKRPAMVERGRSMHDGTYLRYPPNEHIPQNPFLDPEPTNPFTAPDADWSPVATPLDEPVLHTARAVRLSAGHISPPSSPIPHIRSYPKLPGTSEAEVQLSPIPPASSVESSPRRTSESRTRRTSAWASFFRRGVSSTRASEDRLEQPSPTQFSFVNASRESMSKRPIPAHLLHQSPVKDPNAPHRTQSRFREDLPELPMSPPESRLQSPEPNMAAVNIAVAKRGKRAVSNQVDTPTATEFPIFSPRGRKDSTARADEEGLSQSYGSVDSEGSWMSGRLPRHHSSQHRSSLGSLSKPKDDFSASFDRLPVPDHEYFDTLTPNTVSRQVSDDHTVQATPTEDMSPIGTPLRHGTARRRPTIVQRDPRFKSREGLLTEYNAAGEIVTLSREGSLSGAESINNSPVELQKARSVNYGNTISGSGHARQLSAGSVRMLNITPKHRKSLLNNSPSPGSTSQIHQD